MWLHVAKSLIIGIVQAKGMQMPICKHAVRSGNLHAVLWRRYTINAIGGNTKEGVEK